MKRFISILLTSVFILSTLTYSGLKTEAASVIISDEAASGNFVSYLTEQLLNYNSSIDVTYYMGTGKITFEQLSELWYDLLKTDIRLYHVDSKLSYIYTTSGEKSNIIKDIRYNTPQSEYGETLEAMRGEIKEIVAITKPWMTDLEKALAVHDELVLNYKYDKTLSKYSMKNLLVDKTAVCEGYASVFGYVMNELGIVCKLILSESINHIWNLIKIDGNWYHVDVTWDDPVPDTLGYVSHENFLLSDAEAEKTGHKGWNKNLYQSADSDLYKNAFWKEINSEIIIQPDFYYYTALNIIEDKYFKSAELLRKNRSTGKTSVILHFNYDDLPKSLVFPLHLYNGKLYFQTANGVYQMNMSGKNRTSVIKQSGLKGMKMSGNRISYTIQNGSVSTVNVKETNAESIKLDKTSIIIKKGLQTRIKAALSVGSEDYVYWESDDHNVVYCSNTGVIKAMSEGRCVVRAYTESGVAAECKVEVKS